MNYIYETYILTHCRIASLCTDLKKNTERNAAMSLIYQQEMTDSIHVGRELMKNKNNPRTPGETPEITGRKLLR